MHEELLVGLDVGTGSGAKDSDRVGLVLLDILHGVHNPLGLHRGIVVGRLSAGRRNEAASGHKRLAKARRLPLELLGGPLCLQLAVHGLHVLHHPLAHLLGLGVDRLELLHELGRVVAQHLPNAHHLVVAHANVVVHRLPALREASRPVAVNEAHLPQLLEELGIVLGR